ncbi:MAG TPA: hypothetical protein VFS21_38380 [Roseiflexaceae bacterium]|nr:hypothetical protein [Roseiflexaceae bacterium]
MQRTAQGFSTDPRVRIEAEDLEAEAERLQAEIDRLERGQAPEQPEQDRTMTAVPITPADFRKVDERVQKLETQVAVNEATSAAELRKISDDVAELKVLFRYVAVMIGCALAGLFFVAALQIYILASR